jgi:hypothetical protein
MLAYLKARLAEPTTKAALLSGAAALGAAAIGQISWQTCGITEIGLLLPALVPEAAKPIIAELAQAAEQALSPAKKVGALLAAGAVGSILLLQACSSSQIASTQAAIAGVSQDILTTVGAACTEFEPVALAVGATSPTAASYVAYGASVCDPLKGGTVPATVDASTAAWVGAITGSLKALAAVPAAPPAAATTAS